MSLTHRVVASSLLCLFSLPLAAAAQPVLVTPSNAVAPGTPVAVTLSGGNVDDSLLAAILGTP